jgi:hypothetical protein
VSPGNDKKMRREGEEQTGEGRTEREREKRERERERERERRETFLLQLRMIMRESRVQGLYYKTFYGRKRNFYDCNYFCNGVCQCVCHFQV